MPHKFKVNQLVRLTRRVFADRTASTSGVYEVVRLMPPDQTGEAAYRIKSSLTGERAVRESDIAPVSGEL